MEKRGTSYRKDDGGAASGCRGRGEGGDGLGFGGWKDQIHADQRVRVLRTHLVMSEQYKPYNGRPSRTILSLHIINKGFTVDGLY